MAPVSKEQESSNANACPVEELPMPKWFAEESLAQYADVLQIAANFQGDAAEELKKCWADPNADALQALIKTAGSKVKQSDYTMYAMSGIYNVLRSDPTLFEKFDSPLGVIQRGQGIKDDLTLAGRSAEVASKVAWFHSALIGHLPDHFQADDVTAFASALAEGKCTDLGNLEAIVNVLKAPQFREAFTSKAILNVLAGVKPNADPAEVYKCLFAYWLLSFDANVTQKMLKGNGVADQIAGFLKVESKSEKMVSMAVRVLSNFLKCRTEDGNDMREDLGTSGILAVVNQLQYEKWRDEQLPAGLSELTLSLQTITAQVCDAKRYVEEIKRCFEGTNVKRTEARLSFGPLHTPKFWSEAKGQKCEMKVGENAVEFPNQTIVEWLTAIVSSADDPQTIAVACNDIGEIAAQHEKGKDWINNKQSKLAVMSKMDSKEDKQVRREALLCCQKIMLNKWQEFQG
jgi:V-type H+-transporting ATPase subunit H